MNSMKIGTYQMDTSFWLYLPEYTIPAPAPQTKFVKIIGRDGSVDLTEAIGLHYDSRTWSLDFKCFDPTVNWHTLTSQVMNAIHGKRLNFEFDDDPNYFWTGRVSVSSYVSNQGTGTLKVGITSDPYKYKKLSTIVTKNASTATEYTGSTVSFTAAASKITDLSVALNPVQDFHGYGHPWPAGGGENIFGVADATSVASGANRALSVSSELMTVTASAAVSSTAIVTSSALSSVLRNATIPNGTYYFNAWDFETTVSGATLAKLRLNVSNNGNTVAVSPGSSFTVTNGSFLSVSSSSSLNWSTNNYISFRFSVTPANVAAWTPYENICPISGRTGVAVYVSPTQNVEDANAYHIAWTPTVYGGSVDVISGSLKSRPYIASYNGETLVGPWVSSMDVYVSGTTPTTGAQVVDMGGTETAYQIGTLDIPSLSGQNYIWSDGNVTVDIATPETVTNNGKAVVPVLTASADMVVKWGNYSASVAQGTSTVPQLVLENGNNIIYIIGTGTLTFTWQEASL